MLVSILSLCPQGQHKRRVQRSHVAIKRHIATTGAADDEFAFAVLHRSTYQGAMGQDLDRFNNVADSLGCRTRVKLRDVFKEAVKVVKDFRRQLNAGHVRCHLLKLRARGLAAGSPRARAAR